MFVGNIDVITHPELQYGQQSEQRVPPANLFPFRISAAKIADWHFKQTCLALGELDRDLRFEPKIVAKQRNRLEQWRADRLVASPYVGEIEVTDKVAQKR